MYVCSRLILSRLENLYEIYAKICADTNNSEHDQNNESSRERKTESEFLFNCYQEQEPNKTLSSLEHENQIRTTATSGIRIPIRAVYMPLEHKKKRRKEIDEYVCTKWFGLR